MCIFLCLALALPLVSRCLAAMHRMWSSKVKVADNRGLGIPYTIYSLMADNKGLGIPCTIHLLMADKAAFGIMNGPYLY